jgi:hypothetical protein
MTYSGWGINRKTIIFHHRNQQNMEYTYKTRSEKTHQDMDRQIATTPTGHKTVFNKKRETTVINRTKQVKI